MPPYQCPTCGQPHPQGCPAHKRDGSPCRKAPITGGTVCTHHGGRAPQTRKAAQRRAAARQAQADAARFHARTDLHPAEALLELVHYQAGIVTYWRTRVEQLEDDDLEWGTTRIKEGGEDRGTTEEAKPNIAYTLLRDAQHDLATYATAALKAGVQERAIRLAERQGALVAQAIHTALDNLNLTPQQQALVPTVVPAALRQLTQGEPHP